MLLHVKFAHRFDSPACLYTWGKNFTVTENRVRLNVLGIQAETPLEFDLDLPLFKDVVGEASSEKSESVGTMVIHLKKKVRGIWKQLVDQKYDASNLKVKIWWELADVYPRAMNKYNQLLEREEEREKDQRKKREDVSSKHILSKEQKEQLKKNWIKWLNSFQ